MCLDEVIFPVALSALSLCCHVQNTRPLPTAVHGRDTKQALGLALRQRGVFGSICGRKMDSDVLTCRVCSSLGLPDLGLHERVCVYLWEIPILLSAGPGVWRSSEEVKGFSALFFCLSWNCSYFLDLSVSWMQIRWGSDHWKLQSSHLFLLTSGLFPLFCGTDKLKQ